MTLYSKNSALGMEQIRANVSLAISAVRAMSRGYGFDNFDQVIADETVRKIKEVLQDPIPDEPPSEEFYRKGFVHFRQGIRNAIFSYYPNNPCSDDDELIKAVEKLVEENKELQIRNQNQSDQIKDYRKFSQDEEWLKKQVELVRKTGKYPDGRKLRSKDSYFGGQ
jgi:radical SAM superfamily enzyme with C-terminal helix-hairpin-helix motif